MRMHIEERMENQMGILRKDGGDENIRRGREGEEREICEIGGVKHERVG